MDITHLGHACLLVETDRVRFLIDPGTLSSGFADVRDLDAVLVTHEHPDHVDDAAVRTLLATNRSAALVLDELTAARFADLDVVRVAHPGDTLDLGEQVQVLGGTHAAVYADIPGCPNLAYLIADGAFLHPGDSFTVPQQPVDVLAVPIDGPWLKLAEAIDYVDAVVPRIAVPIHDGELTDPAKYAGMLAHLVGAPTTVSSPVEAGQQFSQ